MAKKTEDREDLLRDATAFHRRIEFTVPEQDPIFVGFRQGGAASFYFGQDHVLQFNSQNELRRAFWQDRMLASYQRTMHWLQKAVGRVHVTRTPLTDAEFEEFQAASIEQLRALEAALSKNELATRGEFPTGGNIKDEVSQWLDGLDTEIRLAVHPGIGRGPGS